MESFVARYEFFLNKFYYVFFLSSTFYFPVFHCMAWIILIKNLTSMPLKIQTYSILTLCIFKVNLVKIRIILFTFSLFLIHNPLRINLAHFFPGFLIHSCKGTSLLFSLLKVKLKIVEMQGCKICMHLINFFCYSRELSLCPKLWSSNPNIFAI